MKIFKRSLLAPFLLGRLAMSINNKRLTAIYIVALIYVGFRYGLTLNRIFVIAFLITGSVATYYAYKLIVSLLIALKSARLLTLPVRYYRRKLLIWVIVSSIAFYGFYRTQIPGQLENYKALVAEKYAELTYTEDKPDFSYANAEVSKFNTPSQERRLDETTINSRRTEGRHDNKEMMREITMGWNKTTAETENDNFNWEKATDLVKKYPDYIRKAHGNKVSASKVLAEPWEYYGEIMSFRGQVYSIRQLPPSNSVAQFFGGNCYHAMLAVKDRNKVVTISIYIAGSAEGVAEDSIISVKGYVYGQSRLTNRAGGVNNGLAFVGFKV